MNNGLEETVDGDMPDPRFVKFGRTWYEVAETCIVKRGAKTIVIQDNEDVNKMAVVKTAGPWQLDDAKDYLVTPACFDISKDLPNDDGACRAYFRVNYDSIPEEQRAHWDETKSYMDEYIAIPVPKQTGPAIAAAFKKMAKFCTQDAEGNMTIKSKYAVLIDALEKGGENAKSPIEAGWAKYKGEISTRRLAPKPGRESALERTQTEVNGEVVEVPKGATHVTHIALESPEASVRIMYGVGSIAVYQFVPVGVKRARED